MTTMQAALEGRVRPLKAVGLTAVQRKLLDERFPHEFKSKVMVGIEIELENSGINEVKNKDADVFHLQDVLWHRKEDGSLRNHGIEYVTTIGMEAGLATQSLKLLSYLLKTYSPKIQANARTGVHVHLNFLDKTPSEVAQFSALYLLFEKSLFKFCGGRTQNVFCIPVRDSANAVGSIIRHVRKHPKDAVGVVNLSARVPKYLSFGIGALRTFGTIELRQHEGTSEPAAIIPWLETLVHLYEYAEKQELEPLLKRIRDLNTNSQYETMLREALPKVFIRSLGEPAIIQDMIQGCTYLKEVLIAPEEVGAANPTEDREFGPFVPPLERGRLPQRGNRNGEVLPLKPDYRLQVWVEAASHTTYLRDAEARIHYFLSNEDWSWEVMPTMGNTLFRFRNQLDGEIFEVSKDDADPQEDILPLKPYSRLGFNVNNGRYFLTDDVGKWMYQLAPDRSEWRPVHTEGELFTFTGRPDRVVREQIETLGRGESAARRVVSPREPIPAPIPRDPLAEVPPAFRPFVMEGGFPNPPEPIERDINPLDARDMPWNASRVVGGVVTGAAPLEPRRIPPRFLGRRGPRNNNGN